MKLKPLTLLVLTSFGAYGVDFHQALNQINQPIQMSCHTESDDPCENLANISCTQVPLDDGTGVSAGTAKDGETEFLEEIKKNKIKDMMPEIQKKVDGLVSSLKPEEMSELKKQICPKEEGCTDLNQKLSAVYADTIIEGRQSCLKDSCRPAMALMINREEDDLDKAIFANGTTELQKKTKLLQKEIFNNVKDKVIKTSLIDRVEKTLFPAVKEQITKYLEDSMGARPGENAAQKAQREATLSAMKLRISKVWFQGIDCNQPLKASSEQKEIKSTYSFNSTGTQNALYSPSINSVRVCAGALMADTSEFSIIQTLAHEVTHSIDPNNIALPVLSGDKLSAVLKYSKGPEESCHERIANEYPLKGVINCLRDKDSIASPLIKNYEKVEQNQTSGFKMDSREQDKDEANLPPALLKIREERKLVDQAKKESGLCSENHTDGIGEAYSDWMAAQVLPKLIKKLHPNLKDQQKIINGYANTNRGDCNGHDPTHPTARDRVNQIVLNNPEVRAHMGCTQPKVARARHCIPE